MTLVEDGAVVLFQGDSITDAGRDRGGDDWGYGYAMMAAAWFTARHPAKNVRFINRGIGGDRVRDLKQRWKQDCLDLHPTWLSVYIGINDTWRRYDHHDLTTAQEFEADYRTLLTQARDQLGARLILCEPFVLPVPEDRKQWREDLDPKIAVVRRLAREFDGLLVPLDGLFAQASTQRPPAFWAADGVHPSPPGHALIAQAWLQAVEAL